MYIFLKKIIIKKSNGLFNFVVVFVRIRENERFLTNFFSLTTTTIITNNNKKKTPAKGGLRKYGGGEKDQTGGTLFSRKLPP